jgi:hypothetical protein
LTVITGCVWRPVPAIRRVLLLQGPINLTYDATSEDGKLPALIAFQVATDALRCRIGIPGFD